MIVSVETDMILNRSVKIHFIGIGGIGMSGLAEILIRLGYQISGSDISCNKNVKHLVSLSTNNPLTFYAGHDADNIRDADLVVYSSAIKQDNVELAEAVYRQIPCIHRSNLLAQMIADKLSIIIAGTHGKTTTTSLCSIILEYAGLDPTVINGGVINKYASNAKIGLGKMAVAESDESDGSFRHLSPLLSVITNIERDHMDFYQNMDDVLFAFGDFVRNTRSIGFVDNSSCIIGLSAVCIDCPNVKKMLKTQQLRNTNIVTYGMSDDADYSITNLSVNDNFTSFDIKTNGQLIRGFRLPMFGKHNVLNAVASYIMADRIGINLNTIQEALAQFDGVQRRLTNIGTFNGASVYDDYAHHPTEIRALIDSARYMTCNKGGRVVLVFQPHKHTRLTDLFDMFCDALPYADIVLLTSVYSVNEIVTTAHKTSLDLFNALSDKMDIYYMSVYDEIYNHLHMLKLNENDVVLFAGAGNINTIAANIIQKEKTHAAL